jgi:hypothetical protein
MFKLSMNFFANVILVGFGSASSTVTVSMFEVIFLDRIVGEPSVKSIDSLGCRFIRNFPTLFGSM